MAESYKIKLYPQRGARHLEILNQTTCQMARRMDNQENFVCPICGNIDQYSIGLLNGKPYCRRCISFKGEEVKSVVSKPKEAPIFLSYDLSDEQKELSDRLVRNYDRGINSLVYAVCGSGKTEICLSLIEHCVSKGLKVGFAVPRRSVCYELFCRFRNIFRKNKVISVYGGHHRVIEGDIVCLTTHQLFRYPHYFDLLIMDEIDAFPFKGDEVLQNMFERSIKGNYVLLTATPTDELLKEFSKPGKDLLKLFVRFHHHPLPVPKVVLCNDFNIHYKLIKELKRFISENKQVFIFVPTIDESIKLSRILKLFFHKGTYVNSKRDNNEEIIEDFREKKYQYLVTTAVLERGITVKNLQVIVFHADNNIYDDHSLVQIAGRAGRKKDAPEGEVIFIGKTQTKYMERAISDIIAANQALQDLLQEN